MRISAIILVLFPLLSAGQITLERQVISSFAVNGTGSFYISSTGGQVEHTTGGNDIKLTQGFEQPIIASLDVVAEVLYPECGETATIAFPVTSGCGEDITGILVDGEAIDGELVELGAGLYELVIEAGQGCTTTIEVAIDGDLLIPCDIVFANTMTVNGDGLNDIWYIDNIDRPIYENNTVRIYNRWGQEVWSGLNYDNVSIFWTGVDSDGELLPTGTYFYDFRVGDELIFEGFIELFR